MVNYVSHVSNTTLINNYPIQIRPKISSSQITKMYRHHLLIQGTKLVMRRLIHSMCGKPDPSIKLTILGNMVPTARMVAMLLKQCPGIDEIRLYGTDDNVCKTAIDLAQLDTNALIKAYKGDNRLLRDAITDSKIILICGGYPVSPLEDPSDLIDKNIGAVRNIVLHCVEYNPKAILLVSTPPINTFIPMISEEYKRENVYDPRKIIGISTLSTIVANSLIGKFLKYNPIHVHCPVIGGDSNMTRIPVLSQCTPSLDASSEDDRIALYNTIVTSMNTCLQLKRQENLGPIYLSQAFAITRFVTNLVNAIKGAECIYECAFVRQTGHIKAFLPYMQTIVRLGPDGVAGSYMPRISPWECERLLKAYSYIKNDIHLGSSMVNGELQETKRMQNHINDVLPTTQMLRNEHIGDVMIDFSKKYQNFEIYQ